MKNNHLFVLSGPAGVGKTTIALKLLKKIKNLRTGVTYMTRKPREISEDKKIIHVTKQEFKKMIDQDKFLEWANFYENYYGTGKEVLDILGKNPVLLNIDPTGALQIKEKFPSAILIFVMPESVDILKQRLINRGGIEEKELNLRMQKTQEEINLAGKYDYQVVNKEGKIKETVDEIERIIRKHLTSDI